MTIELTPSILNMAGNLVEVYKRQTQASEQILSDLNIDNSNSVLATVGVQQVPEFVVLQAENITEGITKTWDLSRVNQTLILKSLYIDSPTADNFSFKIIVDEIPIFKFFVAKDETPLSFPAAPLPPNVKIQITANSPIDFIRIVLQPAVILETLIPDEDLPPESSIN